LRSNRVACATPEASLLHTQQRKARDCWRRSRVAKVQDRIAPESGLNAIGTVVAKMGIRQATHADHPPYSSTTHTDNESDPMTSLKTILAASLVLATSAAFAQQAAPAGAAGAPAAAEQPWTYKTKQLKRTDIDKLLLEPGKVLVLDVRRPDELPSKGSFPVFLSIQNADLEKYLKYIPRDRQIITVSNRAHRAGAAGDLLTLRGYKVAGAAGTLDYEEQGGYVEHIKAPPAPATAAAPAVAQAK
jgi:rhodanese-related sulfurtransferase